MDKVNKILANAKAFFGQALNNPNPSTLTGLVPPRPMKFPYTLTAKIVQFPWVHYWKHNWVYKYYFIAIVCCLPAFKSLHDLSNSEGSKKKWAEVQRKQAEEEAHHHH